MLKSHVSNHSSLLFVVVAWLFSLVTPHLTVTNSPTILLHFVVLLLPVIPPSYVTFPLIISLTFFFFQLFSSLSSFQTIPPLASLSLSLSLSLYIYIYILLSFGRIYLFSYSSTLGWWLFVLLTALFGLMRVGVLVLCLLIPHHKSSFSHLWLWFDFSLN